VIAGFPVRMARSTQVLKELPPFEGKEGRMTASKHSQLTSCQIIAESKFMSELDSDELVNLLLHHCTLLIVVHYNSDGNHVHYTTIQSWT